MKNQFNNIQPPVSLPFYERIRNEARQWCSGRFWIWRLPILLGFAWILANHWMVSLGLREGPYMNWLMFGLNFGIHELGHFIWAPFGEFLCILGGSLTQCLVPLIGMAMFIRQRDYFGLAFAFGWLSTNLFYVADYVGDARAQDLPLLSPFGQEDVQHDWYFLLARMNLLDYDQTFAFFIRALASATMLICLVFGAWLLWRMMKPASTEMTSGQPRKLSDEF
jgi:hypothetical protein